jgi:hypothetical protein
MGTLIIGFWPFGVPLSLEAYASDDVFQRTTIAGKQEYPRTEATASLVAQLNVQRKQFRASGGHSGTVEIDDATRDRLRVLGYAPY